MTLMLGRKPAVHTLRSIRTAIVLNHHLTALGAPPAASNDYAAVVEGKTGGDWTMMGNDQVGCCTCADPGHQIMLRTANVGTAMMVPSTQDVLDAYKAVSGWNGVVGDPSDQGADENAVCAYMKSIGILGQKSDDYGSVDPANLDHVRWCTQLFGACRLGINVPQSFIDQFNADQPIDDIGDQNIVGGHDVPVVRYDGQYFWIVTWGKLVPATIKFMANPAYIEEAHAELAFDWCNAQGIAPPGLDLAQLAADIAAVA